MRIDAFQVVPALPERIRGLREMAYNLLWTWDEEIRAIFPRIDRELWESSYQNPVRLLGHVAQQRMDELSRDDSFLAFYTRTWDRFRDYLREKPWWDRHFPERPRIAYFSAEFGLTECLPTYSGGLGVLAGHHLKSASDLGVPLVGVGLLYQQGYFRQYLTPEGWQQESYPTNDFYNLPIEPVLDTEGKAVRVRLRMLGQTLSIQVWRASVGRVKLFLLDTNLPENDAALQDITDQLYGGDKETRIRQEIVLGIGGLRALDAIDRRPTVCHMNEGHSAFLSLERVRLLMQENGLSFAEALELSRAGGVFTTHTSVPAGFDVFPPDLMDRYFGEYIAEMGISRSQLLALGRTAAEPWGGFNMAGLALRASAFVNGVSRLHGDVSQRLLRQYMPNVPDHEVPVGYVTNGAHTRSSVSREMAELFDRYLGAEWWRRPGLAETWQAVDSIPDEELWATHERRRERLVAFARRRLVRQLEQRGVSLRDIERARGVLDTRALTIGFARRFATYKRANLILADPDRLKRILLNPQRPVQIIFAGKAHPHDTEAKQVLKEVVAFCQQEEVRRHVLFLEDYDLVIARYLVQGSDVWLNTPRRGMEASGTSGMKVLPNGGINLSVLDGWWCEAFNPEVGWAIGKGEEYADHAYQDQVESGALYELLEHDIVPLFYGRGPDGLPRGWISRMKKSIRALTPVYSTNRMIWEYAERFYLPAARHFAALHADGAARARALAAWRERVTRSWDEVRVEGVYRAEEGRRRVGDGFEVLADVRLGSLDPQDVCVEIYAGPLDAQRNITEPQASPMVLQSTDGSGLRRFAGSIPCNRSGLMGYTVRVVPCHADATSVATTGLMAWWT